jgi:hypothetical protein
MQKSSPNNNTSSFLDKKHLVNLKTKAFRSGVWFKALRRIDRVLLDLTISVVDKIRSAKLAKSIGLLARRLEDAIKNSFFNHLRRIGFVLAQKTSCFAQKFGNQSASIWASDPSFAVFLAVMHLNDARSCKTVGLQLK